MIFGRKRQDVQRGAVFFLVACVSLLIMLFFSGLQAGCAVRVTTVDVVVVDHPQAVIDLGGGK